MKKTFSIILLLCLCLGVVSCSPEEKVYNSKISSEAFVLHTVPEKEVYVYFDYIMPPDGEHRKPKVVSFNGETYTSEKYDYTENDYKYGSAMKRDYYYAGNGVSFAVESGTDRLVYFHQSFDIREETANGETPPLTIAQEIAKQYLGDLSSYDTKREFLYVSENGEDYATKYTYTKSVQGYSTTDFLSVTVTNSGKIESFSAGQIGAFDSIEKINTEKVEESINNVLAEKFEKDGVVITEKLSFGKRIVLLESKEVHLASCYCVWTKGADGAEKYEYVTVLTYLE